VAAFICIALGAATDLHHVLDVVTRHFPGIAEAQPFVRHFVLPAIADLLVEDAELVTDPVADGGDLEGGQRVHVASCEATESAVAEAGLFLVLEQLFEV